MSIPKRPNRLERAYVALMFLVIMATGCSGLWVVTTERRNADELSLIYDRANDYRLLAHALGEQYVALRTHLRGEAGSKKRFDAEERAFDAALRITVDDGRASDVPVLRSVRAEQDAFESSSRRIMAFPARVARTASATSIIATMRGAEALVQTLNGITTESYEEARREEELNRTFSAQVARALAAGTVLGLLLMSGLALLLVRYNRAAASAALASMTALEQAALTDSLTGLGNHRAFYDDLRREISRAKRHGHPLALALIDVDDFKAINDGGGHARGDDVLADLGRHLARLGRGDRAYRVGGDEFAVLLVEADSASARAALNRLHGEFRTSLHGATVSIGYVDMGPADGVEAFELADTALYEAKRRGRDNVVCFEEIRDAVDMSSTRKAELLKELLNASGVTTAFQPIWDIETTRPFGFEALARPFPEFGFAGPQEVFDVAERKRLLPELDRLCIRKALEAARNLPDDTLIFLNIAPASLASASFDAKEFVATVRAAGLSEHRIVVELTERRIDDTTVISDRAQALRALGVRLALDDTGSGHAGLDILSKVRFDFVKIDRILLTRAARDPSARGVVSGIIAIARETGSYLIAEGIETPELLDFVDRAHVPSNDGFTGIRGVQGYLLGRPAVGAIAVAALRQHHDYLAARHPATVPTLRSVESLQRHEAPLAATAS